MVATCVSSAFANANPSTFALKCQGQFFHYNGAVLSSSVSKEFFVQILDSKTFIFSSGPSFTPHTGKLLETRRSFTLIFDAASATEANLTYVIDRVTGEFRGSSLLYDGLVPHEMKSTGQCVLDEVIQKF